MNEDRSYCIKDCDCFECSRNKMHINLPLPHSYVDFSETGECLNKRLEFISVAADLKKKAKRGETLTFECPVCGSKAEIYKSDFNGHIRAECESCGIYLQE